MEHISVPKLHRYFLDNTKGPNFSKYYPNDDTMTFDEKVFKYTCRNTFRNAWYKIYEVNSGRIEMFMRGDYKQLYTINFNLLVKLFFHAWPHTDIDALYFKESSNMTLHDYIALANRLWAINMTLRH